MGTSVGDRVNLLDCPATSVRKLELLFIDSEERSHLFSALLVVQVFNFRRKGVHF